MNSIFADVLKSNQYAALTTTQQNILKLLANTANKDGVITARHQDIANQLSISRQSVSTAIKEMHEVPSRKVLARIAKGHNIRRQSVSLSKYRLLEAHDLSYLEQVASQTQNQHLLETEVQKAEQHELDRIAKRKREAATSKYPRAAARRPAMSEYMLCLLIENGKLTEDGDFV